MQRVHLALRWDRTAGGDQRLSGHLTAEDALQPGVRLASAEEAHLDLLEVKQGQQLVESVGHACMLPHPAVGPTAVRRRVGRALEREVPVGPRG